MQALVDRLGVRSDNETMTKDTLSTAVVLISKPSALHVPPWQMVSALLDGTPLRTATWWACPYIYSTTRSTDVGCWDSSLGHAWPRGDCDHEGSDRISIMRRSVSRRLRTHITQFSGT